MDTRITISVTDGLLSMIDEWRGVQRPIPSLAESIRRLVEDGVHAHATCEREDAALAGGGFIYNAGRQAAIDGKSERDIPHVEPKVRELWLLGYIDGMRGPRE